VGLHGASTKRFHRDVVGDLTLAYESLDMASEPGFNLTLYSAESQAHTPHMR
jgi:MmyB-like transcription regulator ligand binding domain